MTLQLFLEKMEKSKYPLTEEEDSAIQDGKDDYNLLSKLQTPMVKNLLDNTMYCGVYNTTLMIYFPDNTYRTWLMGCLDVLEDTLLKMNSEYTTIIFFNEHDLEISKDGGIV